MRSPTFAGFIGAGAPMKLPGALLLLALVIAARTLATVRFR
jgi:hypothetical protein